MVATKRISGRTVERAVGAVALATTMFGAGSALRKVGTLRAQLHASQTEARKLQEENRKASEALDTVREGLGDWHSAMMRNATNFNEMLARNPSRDALVANAYAHDLVNQSANTLARVRNALQTVRGANHPSVRRLGDALHESWRKGEQMYEVAQKAQLRLAPGRRGRGHR